MKGSGNRAQQYNAGKTRGEAPKSTVKGIKATGRFDDTVKSLDEARAAVKKAFPDAAELPPAVPGQPYPGPLVV